MIAALPVIASGVSAEAQQISFKESRGTAGPPRVVYMDALPQMTRAAPTAERPPIPSRPLDGLSDAAYAARKALAARRTGATPTGDVNLPPPAGPTGESAGSPVMTPTPGVVFDGIAEVASLCNNCSPADVALAVGDNVSTYPVLQVVNTAIAAYTKQGALAPGYPKSLQSFVGLPDGAFVRQPRALYDWTNHRYIVTFMAANAVASNSQVYLAVSQADDPTGAWFMYVPVNDANIFHDFPRLGQDRQAVYVFTNEFAFNNHAVGAFTGENWRIYSKQQLYAGVAPPQFNQFIPGDFLGLTDSTQPANVYNPTDNPRAEYAVFSSNISQGHCAGGCNGLIVFAISNPIDFSGPGPQVSSQHIGTTNRYFLAPKANQPGLPSSIDTGDTRISGQVTYNAGLLYAALTSSNGVGGSEAILYKIQPTLDVNGDGHCTGAFLDLCPKLDGATITDETVLNEGGSNFIYYPTMQPDPEGNNTIVFNDSNSGRFPETDIISRRVSQAPKSFADFGLVVQSGKAFYNQTNWGAYTAVAPAGLGVGGTPFTWFSGMYAGAAGNWRTTIGKTGFTAPKQP